MASAAFQHAVSTCLTLSSLGLPPGLVRLRLVNNKKPRAARAISPKAERSRDRGSWCDCDASVKESDFGVGGKLREFMKKARGSR